LARFDEVPAPHLSGKKHPQFFPAVPKTKPFELVETTMVQPKAHLSQDSKHPKPTVGYAILVVYTTVVLGEEKNCSWRRSKEAAESVSCDRCNPLKISRRRNDFFFVATNPLVANAGCVVKTPTDGAKMSFSTNFALSTTVGGIFKFLQLYFRDLHDRSKQYLLDRIDQSRLGIQLSNESEKE